MFLLMDKGPDSSVLRDTDSKAGRAKGWPDRGAAARLRRGPKSGPAQGILPAMIGWLALDFFVSVMIGW